MSEQSNEGPAPQVYQKGDSVRVVETAADAVAAKYDGYKLVQGDAPVDAEQKEPEGEKPAELAQPDAAPTEVKASTPPRPPKPRA